MDKKVFQSHLPLLGIFVGALIFRVWFLYTRGSFWFDETYSIHFATLPWHDFVRYATFETNPPLYTLILRYYSLLLGNPTSENTIRLLPMFFGLSTIGVLYFTARRMFNHKTALLSALLLAVMNSHIYWSAENRAYSLLIFLTTLSYYFFYRTIITAEKNKALVSFFIITQTLLLYTHVIALIVIVIEGGIVFLQHKLLPHPTKNLHRLLGLFFILPCSLWLVWAVPSLLSKVERGFINGWFFSNTGNSLNISNTIIRLFLGGDTGAGNNQIISTVAFFLIWGLLTFFGKQLIKEADPTKKITLLFIGGAAIIPPLVANLTGNPITRFTATALPGLALVISYAICLIPRPWNSITTVILTLLFTASATTMTIAPIAQFDMLAKKIPLTEKNTTIMVDPFADALTLGYYYSGTIPILPLYTKKDDLSLDERIARYNWQFIPTTEKQLDEWMKEKLTEKNKVFFVQRFPGESMPTAWFYKNGWTRKEATKEKNTDLIPAGTVYEFSRPTTTSTTCSPRR